MSQGNKTILPEYILPAVFMFALITAFVFWGLGWIMTSYAESIFGTPEEQAEAQARVDQAEREEAATLAAARPISKVVLKIGQGEYIEVLTDHTSGCQYLQHDRSRAAAIVPRLRTDGTPDCDPARID